MVEKFNNRKVLSSVSVPYLEKIEFIDSQEEFYADYTGYLKEVELRAAAKHLNNLGCKYSAVQLTEDDEIVPIDKETDPEQGDILTVEVLKGLVNNQ
jgi:hypothetical protein